MLSKTDKNFLKTYENQLKKPKWMFIVINGLIWALLVQTLIVLYNYFFEKQSLQTQWKESLKISLFIMPLAGLFYGWLMRIIIEKKYKKIRAKELLP